MAINIDLSKAKFIGEGEWEKNSAYQVYELDGKFYSVIVSDQMSKWIVDETIEEITEEQINDYI